MEDWNRHSMMTPGRVVPECLMIKMFAESLPWFARTRRKDWIGGAYLWSRSQAIERGIVPSIVKESVRVILHEHDLKPWRQKMWCIPEITDDFKTKMEDILNVYDSEYSERFVRVRKLFSFRMISASQSWWIEVAQRRLVMSTKEMGLLTFSSQLSHRRGCTR